MTRPPGHPHPTGIRDAAKIMTARHLRHPPTHQRRRPRRGGRHHRRAPGADHRRPTMTGPGCRSGPGGTASHLCSRPPSRPQPPPALQCPQTHNNPKPHSPACRSTPAPEQRPPPQSQHVAARLAPACPPATRPVPAARRQTTAGSHNDRPGAAHAGYGQVSSAAKAARRAFSRAPPSLRVTPSIKAADAGRRRPGSNR
jgi:hypothetical protein